jgi:N6-adenosine-specific RNA methylase IME4
MKKYQIIYADPPWRYTSKEQYGDKVNGNEDGRRKRFAPLERKYNTMSSEEIKSLQIPSENDSACFLWVTDSHLKEGIEVLESWGFKYKTIAFVWLKRYGTGNIVYNFAPWTLKSTEICLLGTKGRMSKNKTKNNVKQFVEAERTKHSKKPDEVRERIETLFRGCSKLEMFARERVNGWDVWGDEVESDVVITSINKSQ